jgi:hypothetical protein
MGSHVQQTGDFSGDLTLAPDQEHQLVLQNKVDWISFHVRSTPSIMNGNAEGRTMNELIHR